MAVATEQSSVVRTATGATTSFPVPFPFASNAHLVVTLAGVLQVLGTHYTVTGAGTGSGEVTMLVAPPAGAEVTIERTVPLVQTTALRSAGTFSPEVHEAALDYRAMAEQQLARRIEALDTGAVALDGSITTAKLADAAVTKPKLAAANVAGSNDLMDGITTAGYKAVYDGTLTITTSGRPVLVMLAASGGAGGASYIGVETTAAAGDFRARFGISANGGASMIAQADVMASGTGGGTARLRVPPGAFQFLWIPPAGTYTLSLWAQVTGPATTTALLTEVQLVAIEL